MMEAKGRGEGRAKAEDFQNRRGGRIGSALKLEELRFEARIEEQKKNEESPFSFNFELRSLR